MEEDINVNEQLKSIGYYDKNPQSFYDRSIYADMQSAYQQFLKYIPKNGRILDAGCGIGRDSLFFLNKGFDVVSFDGSKEMVKMTSSMTGKPAHHMYFADINFSKEFHAIWAQASLLHIPYEHLRDILMKLHTSLLPSGIFYASFKYGKCSRQVEDRHFFDMDEAIIEPYLDGLFHPLEIWKSADTISKVAPSPDKCWLHVIAKHIP